MTDTANSETDEKLPLMSEEDNAGQKQPAPVLERVRKGAADGTLALAGGGLLLLAAVRSLANGKVRALGQAVLGGGLVGVGLRQRRNHSDPVADQSFGQIGAESESDRSEAESSAEKSVSDEAHADVANRQNAIRERTELDESKAAVADEPGEATGPDPEQAQPSQTEATEPERDAEDDTGATAVDDDSDRSAETDEADESSG